MRHEKLYVPGDAGATTLNENVLVVPCAIDSPEDRDTLPVPHIELSCGLCDPRRYCPVAVQAFTPVFIIDTDTGYVWPTVIVAGTLWLTYWASFPVDESNGGTGPVPSEVMSVFGSFDPSIVGTMLERRLP